MAKWKLTRLKFGTEEYTLSEGEKVTVGRGINNVITLSSVVISRNHCVIHVQNNKALITDLQVHFTYFSAYKNSSVKQVFYIIIIKGQVFYKKNIDFEQSKQYLDIS